MIATGVGSAIIVWSLAVSAVLTNAEISPFTVSTKESHKARSSQHRSEDPEPVLASVVQFLKRKVMFWLTHNQSKLFIYFIMHLTENHFQSINFINRV
jgi:hypothetical protein